MWVCLPITVNEDIAEPVGTVDSFDSSIHRAESSSENNSLRLTSFLENSDDLQFRSLSIPIDQMAVIQNINALLSEVFHLSLALIYLMSMFKYHKCVLHYLVDKRSHITVFQLALEKEELIKTLKAESSECSKFKVNL